MPIYTNDPYDDGFFPVEPSLRSSIGIGPKVTKAIDAATKEWLDKHPEATTTVEDDSITNAKLKDGSVNSRTIENESITTDDIADLAVTTPKIADSAVTADKVASSAVDGLRTMSTTQPGVAKVGAGLAMNNGALELDGGDIAPAVTAWLNAHPEATTTVQDGSITNAKLVQSGGLLSEVQDIRLDNNGRLFANAGDSVRDQVSTEALMREFGDTSIIKLVSESGESLSLPVSGDGIINVMSLTDSIITGTRNVWSLLSRAFAIKDGIYTSGNGMTCVVSEGGQRYRFTGTPSANTYFNLRAGFGQNDFSTHNITYPKGTFVFGYFDVGRQTTPQQACSIRNTSNDNFVSTGRYAGSEDYDGYTSTNSFTIDDQNQNTIGDPYFFFLANTEYDIDARMVLLADGENNTSMRSYGNEVSSNIEISSTGMHGISGYTWCNSQVTAYSMQLKDPGSKGMMVRHASRTEPNTFANEVIDVYVPCKNGYVDMILGKAVRVDAKGEVWKLIRFDVCDAMMIKQFAITTPGETEMALKISGRSDFIGGVSHGDEMMDSDNLLFVLDGQIVDISDVSEPTKASEFKLFRTSTLYDPNDDTTVVGTHGVMYTFTEEGVSIDQTVEWVGTYELDASYMPMLCVIRGNDSTSEAQISDTYVDDGNFIPYDVSESGFLTYPHQAKDDVSKIMLLGNDSGLTITLEVLEQTQLEGQRSYLYNGDAYNKIYNGICGVGPNITTTSDSKHTTHSGEKWKTKSKLRFEIG